MKRVIQKDVLSGILLIAIGCFFIAFGRSLHIGQMARMGPGFMPFFFAWTLIILGILVGIIAFIIPEKSEAAVKLRPFLIVTACPLIFGLMIDRLGYFITVVSVMLIAKLASSEPFGWSDMITPVIFSALSAVLFIYALNQPFHLWPR